MSIIFPDLYLRMSDGTKQSYDNIADLEVKLADGEATHHWQKIEEVEKAWKLTIDPNIFEEHADGTKEVSAEILKLLFSTIKVSNTILNRLQKKAGKKWRIGIAFTAVSHSLNRSDGSFAEDGFESGDIISIIDSALNDGTYTVDTVYETQMKVIEDVIDESEIPCIVTIGGKIDILFYDSDVSQFIPAIWNVPMDIEVLEEGEEFSRIKMSSEPRQRYSLDRFTNAGFGLFESGAGTEADPYIITNVWQLQWMNNDKNAWYELGCDINASPTRDWNGGKGFVPIGEYDNWFHGKLDGRDFTIDNLYINRPSEGRVGFFGGSGSNCIVSNLGIINADITGDSLVGIMVGNSDTNSNEFHNCYVSGKVAGDMQIGGFVGSDCNSIFTKCYSTADVEGNTDNVGGFTGYGTGASYTNCYATGDVTGDSNIGGFVGNAGVSSYYRCYSTGAVTGNTGTGGMGGGSGEEATDEDCFWDKETSGQETSSIGIGKTTAQMKQQATYTNWDFEIIWDITEDETYPWLTFVGISGSGTEEDPYIITNVKGLQWMNEDKNAWYELGCDINASPTRDWNAGKGFVPIGDVDNKFVGHFDGKDFIIDNLFINRDDLARVGLFGQINNAIIQNVGLMAVDINGGTTYAGALIGDALNSEIINCYSTGNIESPTADPNVIGGLIGGVVGFDSRTVNCYSTVIVIGTNQAGGLIGNNEGLVSNCYAEGNVIDILENVYDAVGGLVGKNCIGIIENSYATGNVEGYVNVGGLSGDNTGVINKSYSIGNVNNGVAGEHIGGFVGWTHLVNGVAECNDCFWDMETSGQDESAGGTGKTTAQMKQEATYTNWDFETIWDIIEDTTYPWLQVFI